MRRGSLVVGYHPSEVNNQARVNLVRDIKVTREGVPSLRPRWGGTKGDARH